MRTFILALALAAALSSQTKEMRWQHLPSRLGDLPAPGTSREQTGSGTLRWPDILRAARAAGVTRYYIEDESPSAPAQVPLSLRYLAGLRF